MRATLAREEVALDVSAQLPVPLGGRELREVAALWIRTRRVLHVRFGGRSMLPTIAPLAEVVLDCGATPSLGDVVAFVDGDQLTVHRWIAVSRRGAYITAGDASSIPDPPLLDPSLVVGVVRSVDRQGVLVDLAQVPAPAPRRRLLRRICLAVLARHEAAGAALVFGLRRARRLLARVRA
jgi:hypothetical protein